MNLLLGLDFWLILCQPVSWQLIACGKQLTEQVASCLPFLPSATWASTSIWSRSIASETPFSCTSHTSDWQRAISFIRSAQYLPNLNSSLTHYMWCFRNQYIYLRVWEETVNYMWHSFESHARCRGTLTDLTSVSDWHQEPKYFYR